MDNEPVIVNTVAVVIFAIVGTWLTAHGISQDALAGFLQVAAGIIVGVGGVVWRTRVARSKVTPTQKPQP